MNIQIPGTTLIRDTVTMALINQDQNGLNEYMKKRKLLENQKNEINNMKSDISELKGDMQEIKQLILKLMEKSNGS
jgi:hypothetical protein